MSIETEENGRVGTLDLNNVISHRPGPKPNTQYRKIFQGYDIQHGQTTADPKESADLVELQEREKNVNEYLTEQTQAREKYNACKAEIAAFKDLLEKSKFALAIREPDEEQRNTINTLTTTVSNIVLDNADGLNAEQLRQSQAAQHVLDLEKRASDAKSDWDKKTKEYEENNKIVFQLKERLTRGRQHEVAVQGNHVNYIPTRENLSMYKSTTDNIRDVWNLIDGDNLLKLRFSTLRASLENLRRSANEDLQKLKKGL